MKKAKYVIRTEGIEEVWKDFRCIRESECGLWLSRARKNPSELSPGQ